MALETRWINTCDICHQQITDAFYIDAMTYGKTFHNRCWNAVEGPRIANLLDLDDIQRRDSNNGRLR